VHPHCQSADPLLSLSSAACKAWQYAFALPTVDCCCRRRGCSQGVPTRVLASWAMSTHASWSKPNRSEHNSSTLYVQVYLQALTDFLAAICKVSAPHACQNVMQVAVVMQACLLLLAGPTVGQSALLGFTTVSQCCVTSCITWITCVACVLKIYISPNIKEHVSVANASFLLSLHRLERQHAACHGQVSTISLKNAVTVNTPL